MKDKERQAEIIKGLSRLEFERRDLECILEKIQGEIAEDASITIHFYKHRRGGHDAPSLKTGQYNSLNTPVIWTTVIIEIERALENIEHDINRLAAELQDEYA